MRGPFKKPVGAIWLKGRNVSIKILSLKQSFIGIPNGKKETLRCTCYLITIETVIDGRLRRPGYRVKCEKCKKPDFFIHTYTAYTGAAPEAPWGIAVEAGTGGGVREAEETPTASSFSAGGTRREESGEAEPFRKESGL